MSDYEKLMRQVQEQKATVEEPWKAELLAEVVEYLKGHNDRKAKDLVKRILYGPSGKPANVEGDDA